MSNNDARPGTAMERLGPAMISLEPLVDPELSVGYELSSPSSTMLIAFAALSAFRPPPFHLFDFTSGFEVKRLLVRDPTRVWYHRGIPRFGDTIDKAAASLRALLDDLGVERLVTLGSSAGGYAALVFGALLDADLALSFSPQTNIDWAWMKEC